MIMSAVNILKFLDCENMARKFSTEKENLNPFGSEI